MGKAIPYGYRVKIVERIKKGEKIKELAEEMGYSESGIKKIWYTYKKEGVKSFENKYTNCGQSSSYGLEVRKAVAKIRDNNQGGGYVRSKLEQKYPKLKSPSERTLQRWWVGLGIKVTQNTPRRPQENGIVECLQGIMHRWSNPKEQTDMKALQKRLNEESEFQRNHYRILGRNRKTRIELYPNLETNKRIYDPTNFDMKLVDKYLSEKVIQRTIKNNGMVKFNV